VRGGGGGGGAGALGTTTRTGEWNVRRQHSGVGHVNKRVGGGGGRFRDSADRRLVGGEKKGKSFMQRK